MHFADWHDECCADLCVRVDEPPAPGAFILARAGRKHRLDLPRKLATRHVLILGPSGSGKSEGFFLGNCARTRGASFVATDPRGQLWDQTSGYHPRALRLAPREPDKSVAFNWVPLCDEPHRALETDPRLKWKH